LLQTKTAARCGPPLLLSEGLFCGFGWLIADGCHFEKLACPLFRGKNCSKVSQPEDSYNVPISISLDVLRGA
jgi:hypothetical protein